jgi:hypothetical protein
MTGKGKALGFKLLLLLTRDSAAGDAADGFADVAVEVEVTDVEISDAGVDEVKVRFRRSCRRLNARSASTRERS